MIREKGYYKRFVKVGPGGINCGCCFPQTNPARKSLLRALKPQERRHVQRLIKEELE
jgi:hypothetical protein